MAVSNSLKCENTSTEGETGAVILFLGMIGNLRTPSKRIMFMQMDHFTWVGKTQTALHKEKMEKKKIPQGQSPKFFTDLLPGSEEFQRRLGLQCGCSTDSGAVKKCVGGRAWEDVRGRASLSR